MEVELMEDLKRIIHLLGTTMPLLLGTGQCIVEGRLWDQGTTALNVDTRTHGWEDTTGGKPRSNKRRETKMAPTLISRVVYRDCGILDAE